MDLTWNEGIFNVNLIFPHFFLWIFPAVRNLFHFLCVVLRFLFMTACPCVSLSLQPLFPASVLFGLLFSLFLLCPASRILAAAELLSNGVQRLALLRTNSPISTHNDSRPYSPFRHHFIPYVKGKETGHSS